MVDQPNYWQEVFDIFTANPGDAKASVSQLKEKGGTHLDVAITFGGMFLMVMAEHGYTDPHEVWEAVANYEDLRNS